MTIDDNYIVNKIIDILNNESKNLLVGNITSPRPGSICQVSTKYGVKNAYNINCTYPGNAIVVWDKDEEQYYCFTTNPSTILNTRKLAYRKNREIIRPKKTDNYIKILYKSTIGNTVKICIGGCYKVPKVLYIQATNPILDFKINATGKKVDEWIVGFKVVSNTSNNVFLGKFLIYEGATTAKYTSPDVYITFATNKGRGYFESSNEFIMGSQGNTTASFSTPYETFVNNSNPPAGYNASVSKIYPNFLNGQIINTTYSGVAIMSAAGSPISGVLSVTGFTKGIYRGTGTVINYKGESLTIRSTTPDSFGSINGIPINVETYITKLVGNKNQYIYEYKYNWNLSIFGSDVPNKAYIVSDKFGIKETTISFDSNYTNWIDSKFTTVPNDINTYLGNDIKETTVTVNELQNNNTLNATEIKAKFYAIPKATNETVQLLSASYYLD